MLNPLRDASRLTFASLSLMMTVNLSTPGGLRVAAKSQDDAAAATPFTSPSLLSRRPTGEAAGAASPGSNERAGVSHTLTS